MSSLDVRGDIRLGSSGQYRATGGDESLRIIRGSVNDAGVVVRGTGYTASHPEQGKYIINFNAPFTGIPSITATAHRDGATAPSMVVMIDTMSNTSVTFVIRGSNDFWADQAFSFIAIGPQ